MHASESWNFKLEISQPGNPRKILEFRLMSPRISMFLDSGGKIGKKICLSGQIQVPGYFSVQFGV